MSEVLLLNPRGRGRRKTAKRRKNPTPAQRRARAAFAARRASPVTVVANPRRRRRARRRNPIGAVGAYRRRSSGRRSNPINVNSLLGIVKQGAVMGAGAVVADMAYAQIAKFLPANMQAGPGQVNVGSVVKLGLTAAAGQLLSRATNGLSKQAALGAIVVQMRDIVSGFMPSLGVGYAVNAPVLNYNTRIGPNRNGLGAYVTGPTPLLSGNRLGAYVTGQTPLLSGYAPARNRENAIR